MIKTQVFDETVLRTDSVHVMISLILTWD